MAEWVGTLRLKTEHLWENRAYFLEAEVMEEEEKEGKMKERTLKKKKRNI